MAVDDQGMVGDTGDFMGDALGREDEIDDAGGDGAFGHGIVFGGLILGEGDTAFGLNGFEAQGAVGGGSGEHDADGPSGLILGEGFKEGVNGAMGAATVSGGRA